MALAESGFFEQRYRGWLWFEEKEALSGLKAGASTASRAEANEEITVEEAKGEVESIIKELEDLRYVYLARPNFRTQKAYRDKLGEIMDRGIRMQQLWDEQNFIECTTPKMFIKYQEDLLNPSQSLGDFVGNAVIKRGEWSYETDDTVEDMGEWKGGSDE
jgi:hypothetical protein